MRQISQAARRIRAKSLREGTLVFLGWGEGTAQVLVTMVKVRKDLRTRPCSGMENKDNS